jgi:uncharacterized protein with PQ loop repeat
MDEKIVIRVGWFASIMASVMFASYIDQIRLNLSGHPGSLVLPIMTILNGVSWALYAVLKAKLDWPIFICNILGVIVGIVTLLTAL